MAKTKTKTISTRVSPEAARAYQATAERKRKLEVLLSLRLSNAARPKRSLEEIMSEMSRKAQDRGLTPEIRQSILSFQKPTS